MTKVKFEKIRLFETCHQEVSRTACCADMIINNSRIAVEISHSNKDNWIAYNHEEDLFFDLTIEGKNSVHDLRDGDTAEIFCCDFLK